MKLLGGGHRILGVNNFSNLVVDHAEFSGCAFGANGDWRTKKVDSATNLSLKDCTVKGCFVGPGMVSDVTVENLNGEMLIAWGTLFSNVILRGNIRGLMLHGLPSASASASEELIYKNIIKDFYGSVGVAIDMSGAKFFDFALRTGAVPVNKLVLNGEYQIVLRLAKFAGINVAELPVSDYAKSVIQVMAADGMDETVYTIPVLDRRLSRKVSSDIDQFLRLGLVV